MAKVAKEASESPRPWKRIRMAVVVSGTSGKIRDVCREGVRCSKSSGLGILVGIFIWVFGLDTCGDYVSWEAMEACRAVYW